MIRFDKVSKKTSAIIFSLEITFTVYFIGYLCFWVISFCLIQPDSHLNRRKVSLFLLEVKNFVLNPKSKIFYMIRQFGKLTQFRFSANCPVSRYKHRFDNGIFFNSHQYRFTQPSLKSVLVSKNMRRPRTIPGTNTFTVVLWIG